MMLQQPVLIHGLRGSGNSQKAILGCALMGIKYNLKEPTALWGEAATKPGGAKSPEFLAISPRGLIPVIEDPNFVKPSSVGLIMHDSTAILTYLALSYNSKWYPINDPIKAAKINFWFGFSSGDIQHTLLKVTINYFFHKLPLTSIFDYYNQVRIGNKFGVDIAPFDIPTAISISKTTLSYLNSELLVLESEGHKWLVPGDEPTVADIAVFPYVAFAEDSSSGALQLKDYPAVLGWVSRFKGLPGYEPLPGT